MPFCSRCGDICKKDERCNKCGGVAVGGQVKWPSQTKRSDSWIRTYVEPPKSTSGSISNSNSNSNRNNNNTNRRNRPEVFDSNQQPQVEYQLPDSCPASPLLETADGTLTKLVGSVLSPESPTTHPVCMSCSTPFPPNSTLYIHPHDDIGSTESRAFCYHCYVANFSKGDCVVCRKAVIGELKVEGVYINTKCGLFHSNCFNCDGCGVSLKNDPITDLDGWPCCIDCFEGSAYRAQIRRSKSGRRQSRNVAQKPSMDSAMRDLNHRLGLASAPNNANENINSDSNVKTSPRRSGRVSMLGEQLSGVELTEASNISPKQRESLANLADIARDRSIEFDEKKQTEREKNYVKDHDKKERRVSARDLVGARGFEGVEKYASPPNSPPNRASRRSSKYSLDSNVFPRPSNVRSRSQSITSFHDELSGRRDVHQDKENTEECAECKRPISAMHTNSNKQMQTQTHIVSVPGEGTYHADCLLCAQCGKTLAGEGTEGKLSVVKLTNGRLGHKECAPAQVTWTLGSVGSSSTQVKPRENTTPQTSPQRKEYSPGLRNAYTTNTNTNTPPKLGKAVHATLTPSPSTLNARRGSGDSVGVNQPKGSGGETSHNTLNTPSPPKKSLWATRSSPFSRSHFGGMSSCPSCGEKLTLFECTPGPAGTKYHSKCLRCRGCAKDLDSFAKVDFDGWVWCRGCFDTYVPKPRPLSYHYQSGGVDGRRIVVVTSRVKNGSIVERIAQCCIRVGRVVSLCAVRVELGVSSVRLPLGLIPPTPTPPTLKRPKSAVSLFEFAACIPPSVRCCGRRSPATEIGRAWRSLAEPGLHPHLHHSHRRQQPHRATGHSVAASELHDAHWPSGPLCVRAYPDTERVKERAIHAISIGANGRFSS
ncbi:hypothetical protein E3P94_03787 [Wallemia ichthyophaga]|nr:hypothetical protein E3P95_03792 [Wallemia ichthyophaga]TIA96228.1 hypothetical protein E3P94_03787 [Wallemia ichthyophaga]